MIKMKIIQSMNIKRFPPQNALWLRYQFFASNFRQTCLLVVRNSNFSKWREYSKGAAVSTYQRKGGGVHHIIYISRDSNPGSSVGNARWWPLHYWCDVVPRPGFEPGTTASSGQRSPTELPGQTDTLNYTYVILHKKIALSNFM